MRAQASHAENPLPRVTNGRPEESIAGNFKRLSGMSGQTVTWVPTSTTRPVGIWKKSVASLAERASPMNRRSYQRGSAECAAGRNARRDRKNDVDMMSNCQPLRRAMASAFGTFGVSM